MMDREKASEAVRALCEHFGIEDDATDEYDGMDPYQILVSTIVSQQISEASTRRICSALFSEFPSMEDVRHADPVRFEEAIKASRYHHQKACCILSATRMIAEDFGGEVPDDLERLRMLPGVGDKTAACVMRYGFGKRTVIVDSHINRVSNRLGISGSKRPADTQKAIAETVPEEMWGLLDKGFIALGRTFCRPKGPLCEECPVNRICEHNIGRQPGRRSLAMERNRESSRASPSKAPSFHGARPPIILLLSICTYGAAWPITTDLARRMDFC
ncbi:MAG: endonuclease III [Candidatus Methanomethylophilaceae archaeon]|nr:endonuclease III [Candidatus Methanomethylophilaceae archaeon]